MNRQTRITPLIVLPGVLLPFLASSAFAAKSLPPASPEATAAMQPYLDGYKLAGAVAIVADKSGRVHYRNLLGYADVEAAPILHVCGSLDPLLESNTREAERRYKKLGGKITVLVDESRGHFPTSPTDPQPVVQFITASDRVGSQR